MEGGVEAYDLRQLRPEFRERLDGCQVVGLVEWRERNERLELLQDVGRHADGSGVLDAPVNHAVPRSDHGRLRCALLDPGEDRAERVVVAGCRPHRLVRELGTGRIMRDEVGTRAETIDLTAEAPRERRRSLTDFKHRELDRRRARVYDEQEATQYFGPRRAERRATAHEAMRAGEVSARLVNTIGTRAPSTSPASCASPRYSSCLASMLPDSRSGTTRMSARPATADSIPLAFAAASEIALSKASGPSRIPPVICLRSAILQSAAASIVEGISGFSVSTAERVASLGASIPRPWAGSVAFGTRSRLAAR